MNNEKIVGKGKIFQLVQITQADGRIFEVARRAPGVRLIIPDRKHNKVLLTKEFRNELQAYDYRLPGGKVFDTLDEYKAHRAGGGDIMEPATAKAKNEGAEEAGIVIKDLKFFKKSTLGATVEWDLFVFEVIDWEGGEQALEHGELIETGHWFDHAEVERMILNGQMHEERIALILLQWLNANA